MWSISFATLLVRCMELKNVTTEITDSYIFSECCSYLVDNSCEDVVLDFLTKFMLFFTVHIQAEVAYSCSV